MTNLQDTTAAWAISPSPAGLTDEAPTRHAGARLQRKFSISGAMIYLDAEGRQTGYEEVFCKIDMCRKHYAEVGLGAQYVDQFVR